MRSGRKYGSGHVNTRLFAALQGQEPLTAREIAAALDWTERRTRNTVAHLMAQGKAQAVRGTTQRPVRYQAVSEQDVSRSASTRALESAFQTLGQRIAVQE